jgi:hypothetical protein
MVMITLRDAQSSIVERDHWSIDFVARTQHGSGAAISTWTKRRFIASIGRPFISLPPSARTAVR